MKTLRNVNPGETVTIVKLHGEGATKRRIMDMGLTKGTNVTIQADGPDAQKAVEKLVALMDELE